MAAAKVSVCFIASKSPTVRLNPIFDEIGEKDTTRLISKGDKVSYGPHFDWFI